MWRHQAQRKICCLAQHGSVGTLREKATSLPVSERCRVVTKPHSCQFSPTNMNERNLPVNALSQLRRRKFQRRCSVTEHTLRAARHVREILYREECLRRQPIDPQEIDSMPSLVATALESLTVDSPKQRTLKRHFNLSDEVKCIAFQASWGAEKVKKPWQNNSLMALAAPFLMHDDQWGTLENNLSAGNELTRETRRHCKEMNNSEEIVALESRHKKPRIEKPTVTESEI